MELTLNTLVKDSILALKLLSCDSIVPIYTNTVYGTSCDYSVKALSWSYSSFLVISFFGMIMITLRSAWHDVMYTNDYEAKNLEPEPFLETAPDDEPPQWNAYDKEEPVEDYGGGYSENHHHEYRDNGYDEHHANDLSSYQDDEDHHNNVEYYEEPQVVHDAKHRDGNGFYRSNVY